jgi:creatinine amidohydrolase
MTESNASSTPIRFDALTRDELTAAAPHTTLVIPVGSTEQHGHHLPTRVDAAIVEAVALRGAGLAAEQIPVLVAPTLPYGCSHHHLPFGGTMSLTTTTYVEVVCDLVAGLAQQGFGSIVLLNGHGGNDAALRVAVDRLTNETRCGAHVAATSYFHIASSGWTPGHAGHFETSLLLALAPELVHLDRRPHDTEPVTPLGRDDLPGGKIGRPGLWEASDGRTDDAREASREAGERLLDEISRAVADFLVAFHRSSHPSP